MSISPARFAQHAAWLADHRDVLPLTEVLDRCAATGRVARGTVALTFDDGFASLHEHALPILTRYRLPSTVFLVARTLVDSAPVDWVDLPPPAPLRCLDAEQIEEMQLLGVRFESHSWRHADLTSLGFDECVRDLRDSRELLETVLGHRVRILAYPRGRHSPDVRAAAVRAGYHYALALPESREVGGRYAVPRVGIHRHNNSVHLRLKTSPDYLALRTGRIPLMRPFTRPRRPT